VHQYPYDSNKGTILASDRVLPTALSFASGLTQARTVD